MEKKLNPVNWFEIPVKNMERAKVFYEHIFEIRLTGFETGHLDMSWFPFDHSAPGASGSLVLAESYTPSHSGSMVYFSVEDILNVLGKVETHGGKVLNPKTSIGEYGFVAHFEDTEGNRVGLHSVK